MNEPTTKALTRLSDAISGERRDWHEVGVRPDDIAAVLAALDRSDPAVGLREALRVVETAPGFIPGMTVGDDFESGLRVSPFSPALSDWLQRGPLLASLRAALAATPTASPTAGGERE